MVAEIARDRQPPAGDLRQPGNLPHAGNLPRLDGLPDFVATLAADDEPGLAVGVYAGGERVATAAAGCALPEHGLPVTEHTAFDIASVSKHVTAACVLLVARDRGRRGHGRLDLDADVRASLPELRLAQPVTLRQCLTHTAGLRDYFALCEIFGIGAAGITEDRFTDLVAGQADLDFPAGSAFSYSNTGYALTAALVRRVTGSGLARFAAERVFGPLGMTATHFRDDVSLLVPGLAGGYVVAPARQPGRLGTNFRRYDVTEEVVGDGAVVTTVADLAAWHAFMATGAVLGTDIRDGLLARQVLTDGTQIGYALGLESIDVGGNAAWWHSGSWAGYRAAVIYLPALGAGVSVLANRDDRYASHVALAVATALTGGGDPRTAYLALTGDPAPAERASREAEGVAGLWHEPGQDVFVELEVAPPPSDPSQIALRDHGGRRFVLCADGSWHGIGPAAGSSYTVRDGALIANWGLSDRPEGRYQRAEPKPPGSLPPGSLPPAPAGIFFNEEVRAHAEIRAGESGAAEIVIGLAAPRPLIPAGDGAWRGSAAGRAGDGAVTVRLADDGSSLLVSAPGARRVRFDRVPGARAGLPVMRGLRGAR